MLILKSLLKRGFRLLPVIRRNAVNVKKFQHVQSNKVVSPFAFTTGLGVLYLMLRNSSFFTVVHAANDENNPNLREQFNFIDKIAKKCASAVVYIEIKDTRKIDPSTGDSLVTSNGSGFIIAENGWILTNAHVVINKPQAAIMVMMNDGATYQASLEETDMNLDLALIRIYTDEELPYLNFAKDNDTTVGEWVVAMGSPLCLSHSITVGVVSSINRTAADLGLRNYTMKYIQTDAAITFGNSGGPLINLDGNVIGINNLRITSGIAFAIPIEYARHFLENTRFSPKFQEKPSLDVNCLGITTFSVTPYLMRELLLQKKLIPVEVDHGVLIWKVLKGTPADESGLKPGDVITHVNGVPVKDASDIYILHSKKNGHFLKMDLIRDGKKTSVSVKTK